MMQQQQHAAAVPSAAVAQLCLGNGPAELNLKAVQQRVADLMRVIETLLADMHERGDPQWTSLIDKLAVINMSHMQIMSDVRPLLRQYAVYPKYVDNPGIEASIPEMLASRLLPEQIEQEAAWQAQMPGGLAQLASQPNLSLEYADAQVGELQDLVGWLTNLQHVLRSKDATTNPTPRDLPVGVLDPKGKLRREVDATSKEIAAAAIAAAAAQEQAGMSLQGQGQPVSSVVVVGQKRARPGAPAPAAPLPADAAKTEADALLAKIIRGELWPGVK